MHRENQNAHPGVTLNQPADQFDPADIWQPDIEHDDVRCKLTVTLGGLPRTRGLADDDQIGLRFE